MLRGYFVWLCICIYAGFDFLSTFNLINESILAQKWCNPGTMHWPIFRYPVTFGMLLDINDWTRAMKNCKTLLLSAALVCIANSAYAADETISPSPELVLGSIMPSSVGASASASAYGFTVNAAFDYEFKNSSWYWKYLCVWSLIWFKHKTHKKGS